jgi:hypothetical protein
VTRIRHIPVAGQSGEGTKSNSGFPGLNDRLQLCGEVLQVRSSGLPLGTGWPANPQATPGVGWGVELYEDCQECLRLDAVQRLQGRYFRACGLCRGTGLYDQALDEVSLDFGGVWTGDPCPECEGKRLVPSLWQR